MHDKVIRVVKHLIKDFDVNLEDIKQFNTRKVLGNLSYLNETRSNNKGARKNKNTRKNRK